MEQPEPVEKLTRMPSVPVTLLANLPGRYSDLEIVRVATNEVVIRNTNLEAVIERGICVGMFETSRFHEAAVGLVYHLTFNRKLDLALEMMKELPDSEISEPGQLIAKVKAHNTKRNRIAHRHDARYSDDGSLEVIQRRASGGNAGPARVDSYGLAELDNTFFAAKQAVEKIAGALWPSIAATGPDLSHWEDLEELVALQAALISGVD